MKAAIKVKQDQLKELETHYSKVKGGKAKNLDAQLPKTAD